MTFDTINDAQTVAGSGEGTLLANRYRVVRQLGQGGMGSVWLAEDTQLDNKPFAIKMLPAILVSNKRAYRQLKDEALVAMKLTHPNIVTLRDFEENNGNPFLVMDYIDGQTLDDYLAERGQLSEDDVIRVLRPIAAALDYAHSEGVVHRDVKPANVMIRKDGHPYILDFGIAREIQETMTRVTGKLSSGTLLYMSPEQLRGHAPKPAQDIYSFAAMAYECLKGEPPFVRGQIEFQILNEQPESPPGGTQLVASVMSGLAKKPEDRPKNCVAVLEGNISRGDAEMLSMEAGEPRLSRPKEPEAGEPRLSRLPERQTGGARSPSAPPMVKEGERVPLKHNKVQLWAGGPYWADTNIGAEKPWEYGYYFWWGDTVGYKFENNSWTASDGSSSGFSFSEKNTPTCNKNIYTLYSERWIIEAKRKGSWLGKLFDWRKDNVLSPEHDAVQVQWGDGWRMPTRQEVEGICEKCNWTRTTLYGVNGYVVCGKGEYVSASIFLPLAGYGLGTSLLTAGTFGSFWSSVPGLGDYMDESNSNSWSLYCLSSGHHARNYYRYCGRSVRPVQGIT